MNVNQKIEAILSKIVGGNIWPLSCPLEEKPDKWIIYLTETESPSLHGVRRHIVGGANRTLISVETPHQLCRIGTCRRLSAGCPQIVVALFEKQQPVLLLK